MASTICYFENLIPKDPNAFLRCIYELEEKKPFKARHLIQGSPLTKRNNYICILIVVLCVFFWGGQSIFRISLLYTYLLRVKKMNSSEQSRCNCI